MSKLIYVERFPERMLSKIYLESNWEVIEKEEEASRDDFDQILIRL